MRSAATEVNPGPGWRGTTGAAASLAVALLLAALPARPVCAAQVCAWIVETVEDDGGHKFELDLVADTPTSLAVGLLGPGFTSAARGGELIPLQSGQPEVVDGEGFDVAPGDALRFEARLFQAPIASLDDLKSGAVKPLAVFVFQRTVGDKEAAPPGDLATRQCAPIG